MEPVACCVTLVEENERLLRKIDRLKFRLRSSQTRLAEMEDERTHGAADLRVVDSLDSDQSSKQVASMDDLKALQLNFLTSKAKLLAMHNKTTRLYHSEVKKSKELQVQIDQLNHVNVDLQDNLANEKQKTIVLERRISELESEQNNHVTRCLRDFKQKCSLLENENEQLKKELSCFDEDFFEELEDMKYAFKKSKELNDQYEKTLRAICTKYNIPLPDIR